MPPNLTLIVAMSKNRVIGRDGGMPWHLKADLKYFKAQTLGHRVVMGRRTFESIGRPLPGRENVVVSRSGAVIVGCTGTPSLDAALSFQTLAAGPLVSNRDTIFVAGGGEIYRQLMQQMPANLTRLLVTEIDVTVDGDTRFPIIEPSHWSETERIAGQEGDIRYHFVTYLRARSPSSINS